MTDFYGQRTAAYNKPNIKLGKGKVRRQPFMNQSNRETAKELIDALSRMSEATTEAAYHLRKNKASALVKRLRLHL